MNFNRNSSQLNPFIVMLQYLIKCEAQASHFTSSPLTQSYTMTKSTTTKFIYRSFRINICNYKICTWKRNTVFLKTSSYNQFFLNNISIFICLYFQFNYFTGLPSLQCSYRNNIPNIITWIYLRSNKTCF